MLSPTVVSVFSLDACSRGFPDGLTVKNMFAMQETWAWSLGQDDPPEEEMATHSNILAWKIP